MLTLSYLSFLCLHWSYAIRLFLLVTYYTIKKYRMYILLAFNRVWAHVYLYQLSG